MLIRSDLVSAKQLMLDFFFFFSALVSEEQWEVPEYEMRGVLEHQDECSHYLPYWLITSMVAHASSPSPLSQEILGFLFYIVFVSLFEKGNFFSICENQVKRSCVVRNWHWEERILTNWVRQVNSLMNSLLCSVAFLVTSLFIGTVWGGPAQDLLSMKLNLPHTSMVRMVS